MLKIAMLEAHEQTAENKKDFGVIRDESLFVSEIASVQRVL